jgi:hypothetical protein
MYVLDITLAMACVFFGLAIIAPLLKGCNRYERYVRADGSVIEPETALRMLAADPEADIDVEWFSTGWQDRGELAAEGWRLVQSEARPFYSAMLGFGGIALLAASTALPLSFGEPNRLFAWCAFAAAGLFGSYRVYRFFAPTADDSRFAAFNDTHLFVAVLALLAGLRLY